MTLPEQIKLVEMHCAQLREHFDSVQIFCSLYDEGKTRAISRGEGNWYARDSQCREWFQENQEKIRDGMREKPDDSGEDWKKR